MSDIIELQKQTLSNGCICPFVYPVIQAAVKAAKPREGRTASERATARFIVKIDGERHEFKQERTLAKFLMDVAIGSRCRVFRNAGFGATVDFDL